MSKAFLQGIVGVQDNQPQIRNDISVVSTNWFVNRCPLVSRLPRVAVESTIFSVVNRQFRPRTVRVGLAVGVSDSTISFQDASGLMNGDVLELPSGERVELVGDPTPTNAVAVRRGAEGTTPAAALANDVARLIGNSRTGAEVDQNAVSFRPTAVDQFCQTWQHPVQVGGSLQATTGFVGGRLGISTPFDQNKMDALQNLMDDMEVSCYYGRGEHPSISGRPKQKGLRALLTTNLVTNPVSAASYKPTDLIRDTLERCRTNGGSPDVLLVSPNFMTGLAVWGHAAQRIDAGVNAFGTPIEIFEAPFLGGITLIEAPLLKPSTAICLTSSELRLRVKRNEFWNPRGIRGDAVEGEWIAEGAIEVQNESHHAWVEGITGFSAS